MPGRIIRNVFSNWAGFLITGIVGLALTPFMIRELGVVNYGIWILVSTIVDYYGLLDTGIRTTLQRYVAKFKGGNQREALNQTFATVIAMGLLVVVFVLAVSAVLMEVLPGFFNVPAASEDVFADVLGLLALTLSVSLLARLFGAYLCGFQRFDLYNVAAVSATLLRGGLIVWALLSGYGLLGVAGASLAAAMFSLALHVFLVRRVDSQACFTPWRGTVARAKELVRFGFFVFLNAIGDYLRFYTSSIVVGKMLGVAFVTPFSIATRLVDYYRQLIISVTGPLMPVMSGLEGAGDRRKLQNLFLRSSRMTMLLSLFLGLILVFDGYSILVLWLGNEFVEAYNPYPILVILACGFMVMLGQGPSTVFLQAVGRHQMMGIWTIGEGIANVALSIMLAPQYGLVGVAWGVVIPMFVSRALIQPWYTLRVAGISTLDYVFKSLARPLVVGGMVAWICMIGPQEVAAPSFLRFLGTLTWQTTLYFFLAYLIGLYSDERSRVREWFNGFVEGVGRALANGRVL